MQTKQDRQRGDAARESRVGADASPTWAALDASDPPMGAPELLLAAAGAADWERARKRVAERTRTLIETTGRGLDLTEADLSGLDLSGFDLSRATLNRAQLHATKLDRATLVGASIVCPGMERASLRGADLTGAYLHAFAAQ